MVFPAPDMDTRRSEAKATITLDQVVEFIQNAPPEFIDYLMSLLAQEEGQQAPPSNPNVTQALDAVSPVR